MRYKAQSFPFGEALYLIAEKKREAFPGCMEIFRKLSTIFRGEALCCDFSFNAPRPRLSKGGFGA
jgi:hypothetical protein